MSHPDDSYITTTPFRGEIPDDLHTAHVRHDDEVWTESGRYVCMADSFDMAKEIARCLRHREVPSKAGRGFAPSHVFLREGSNVDVMVIDGDPLTEEFVIAQWADGRKFQVDSSQLRLLEQKPEPC